MSALIKRNENTVIYIVAMVASLLLSFWINVRETVINPDAICYLTSAEAVGRSSMDWVMHLCTQSKWPFYSTLIYGFVQITHLSYAVAAYTLNAFFSLLSVVMFISIAKELGASRRVLWLAASVVLLSHEFDSVRQYIVRDHGFWAFYLSSIYCLLRYVRKPTWQMALAWCISMSLATLFRIEGAIFMLLLPWLSWCCVSYSLRQRMNMFLSLNVLTLLGGVMVCAWLLLHPDHTLAKLGRLAEIPNQLQHGLMEMLNRLQIMKNGLAQHVLTSDSSKQAGLVLFLLIISWYIASVVANVSMIYALLVVYAWVRGALKFSNQAGLVVGAYLAINLLITFGFLLEHEFLSKRYLIALSLTLMIWVPFALDALLENLSNRRQKVMATVIVLAMVGSGLGGIFNFGHSKTYIHDAGVWMAANIPASNSLYVNDEQVMYYTKRFGDAIFKISRENEDMNRINHGQWKQYDYLALRVTSKEASDMAALLQEISLTPMKVFENERGDKVLIYKVR